MTHNNAFEEWVRTNALWKPRDFVSVIEGMRAVWNAGRASRDREVNDLLKRFESPTALTRDDILRWPESEDGLRRLRDECAKIAGVNMMYGGEQPDRDANLCQMVIDAMAKDGWDWRLSCNGKEAWAMFSRGKQTVQVWYAELPDADWLTKTCLAACIATLVKA